MNLGFLIALGLALAGLALVLGGWFVSTRLIHPPHRRAETSPANYQLEFENISFRASDGLSLRGWFIPAANPRGTIIVCHGYTGECSPDLVYAPLLHQHQYHTLYFDFRGHGISDGTTTSLVYYERRDLLAAIDFLRARGIDRVGLLGLSMGGAIALATAPASPSVIGVIADCGFGELRHVVAQGLIHRHLPKFLASILGWLVVVIASARVRANLFSADPIHWVSQIAPRPLLLMQAGHDDDVPLSEGRALFAAAREPKELWTVPNATHREIENIAPEEYRKRVIEFFDQAFGKEQK